MRASARARASAWRSQSGSWGSTAAGSGSRASSARGRPSPSPSRRDHGRRADSHRRGQREEPKAGARRAPGEGLPDDRGRDGRGRRAPGEGAPSRARPDGHPAARDRRHHRPRPAPRRRGDARHSRNRGAGVGDDARPAEDHGGGLRRLPVQADPGEGVPPGGAGDARPEMTTPAKILVVDDTPQNVKLLADLLAVKGYAVATASSGAEALEKVEKQQPDLVLLDVVMPEMSGYEVCRKIRGSRAAATLPVIMVTALDPAQERVKGIEAGADDFLTKPINRHELLARVKSLLRIKVLHDELGEWNRTLERRVEAQVAQLERLARLKRFFSPQLAEMIVSGDADDPLNSHRRESTVRFLDLRGFTAFAETSEPEEVMGVLREYHAAMGRVILEHEGTLERFTGDGMMIFFNDPVLVPDAPERAVRMAVAMRDRVDELLVKWRRRGYELDFGIGIAQGYATIGAIGFEGRMDYGAIGTVTNLAARLCGEAKPRQILISQRVLGAVEALLEVEELGGLTLKGFSKPVAAFNVLQLKGS